MTAPRPRHGDVTVTRDTGAAALDSTAERDHLRREHGLTRVDAWITERTEEVPATRNQAGSAARMAKLRARRRDAGLVSMDVPAEIATEVAAAGGWQAWRGSIGVAAILDEYKRMAATCGTAPDAIVDLFTRPSPWRRLVLHLLA